MRATIIGLLLLTMGIVSCGPGAPQLATPSQGQVFDLDRFGSLSVTLADNDYRETQIQFIPDSALSAEISCNAAPNSIGICTRNSNHYGGYAMCDAQRPCALTIMVYRGGYNAVVTVYFRRGTPQ